MIKICPLLMMKVLVLAGFGLAHAQSTNTESQPKTPDSVGYPNWNMPTMGGLQFWTDVRFVGGWKIQRNSNTGHHRLIDERGDRHAWGNLTHCEQELEQRIARSTVQPNHGKIVIVMHGLSRTNQSMTTLSESIAHMGDFTVINFQYASTRETVETHAGDLRCLINGLGPAVTEINFVCHSLGNIVVRCYLGDANQTPDGRDPRINRMVMLGPPNHGSRMARVLKNSFLFKTLAGAPGAQLGMGWKRLEPRLATPDFEFGIIAGGQDESGDFSNFILRGPDDFTVSLTEAKLIGARDLLVRPLLHSSMMNQPEVLKSTLCFLHHGYFVSESECQPIDSDKVFK